MKKVILVLVFSLVSMVSFAQILPAGTEMPKAVFYTTSGATYSTDQIPKGKKTLLMFFDATCEHCQKVAAAMSKRSKELGNINLVMVTQDEQRSIDYFMGKFGKPLLAMKNLTILQDKDRVFIPLFKPKQFPSLYLFGLDRRIIYSSHNDKEVDKFFGLIGG